MTISTTLQIVQSYVGLLIMQYLNKPKASGFINAIVSPAIIPQTSVQTIAFSAAPSSGTFVLSYNGINSATINWNDSVATIQSDLRAITGLSSVTVTGSIASQLLTVTFTGVAPPALLLSVFSNTLFLSSSVSITITETDETLPLAVQDGFNLIAGTGIASGVQLDVLGAYAGVTRSGQGFTQPITLDDSDFYQFIQMAIIRNQSGSSLATIQSFLNMFFPNEIFVTDNANMTMIYIISQSAGSENLVQLFVTEGLLPIPMAVGVTIYFPPTGNLFSFRTYEAAAPSYTRPFNDYASYQTTWAWLSYRNIVTP